MPNLLIVLVTCSIVTFASFISGMTGFGNAVIFQTIWAMLGQSGLAGTGDLKEGVAITFLSSLTSGVIIGRDSLRSGEVKWDIVAGLVPGGLIFNFVGTAALATLNQDALKKALGLLFLVFACWQLYLKSKAIISKKQSEHAELLLAAQKRNQLQSAKISNSTTFPITPINVQQLNVSTPAQTNATYLTPATSSAAAPQESDQHDCDWPLISGSESDQDHSLASSSPALSSDASLTVGDTLTSSSSSFAPISRPVPCSTVAIELVEVASSTSSESSTSASPPTPKSPDLALSDCAVDPLTAVSSSTSTHSFSPALWWSFFVKLCHQRQFQVALAVGSIAGFLGGCFGTNGPPIMAFFSMITITKGEVRGTFAWANMIGMIPKLIGLLVFNIFDSNDWPIYILLPPITIFGTWLGNLAHHAVDVNVVMMMLQFIVLLSTVALCGAFDGTPFALMMLVIYMAIVILIVGFIIFVSSATYRFLRSHPECTTIYLEEVTEKLRIEQEKERAERLGQTYESRPELRNADGTRTGYTSWHN